MQANSHGSQIFVTTKVRKHWEIVLSSYVKNVTKKSQTNSKNIFAVIASLAMVTFSLGQMNFVSAASVDPSITISSINGISGPPYSFTCDTNPLFNPVTLSGSGSGEAPPGDASQYAVQVDWGDGNQTNGLGNFTPDSGHVPFTFTFTGGPHNYAASGNFVITASLYHVNPPGNDNQADNTISIPVCVSVTPTTTGTLVIKKVVINGDDGTAVPADFSMHVKSGANDVSGSPQNGSADPGNTYLSLATGDYTVSETGGPSGYSTTFSGECAGGNVTVVNDQTVTCTVTNSEMAHIIVDKVTNPSEDSQSFDFVTTGNGYNPFSLTDMAAPNDQLVAPGVYTVAETAVSGWDLANGHPTCIYENLAVGIPVVPNGEQLTLTPGASVTCTFTNTFTTSGGGRFALNITTSGDGNGVVTGDGINCDSNFEESVEVPVNDCEEVYAAGTPVELTATADEGSNFDNSWSLTSGSPSSNSCTGNTTPCHVTINGPITLNAHFDANSSGGGGGGSRSGNRTTSSSTPQGQVLGDSIQAPVTPMVAGATTELPRTGLPVVVLLALLVGGLSLWKVAEPKQQA